MRTTNFSAFLLSPGIVCLSLFLTLTSSKVAPIAIDNALADCSKFAISDFNISEHFSFAKFGSWQRPRYNSTKPVDVNISLVLSAIDDILERERLIRLTGYLDVSWVDEFRKWDTQFPYNCLKYVVIPAKGAWLPDIAQVNNPNGRYALVRSADERMRIHQNGLVEFSPGGTFTSTCEFDLSLFPFDTQTCKFEIESWKYSSTHVRFHLGSDAIRFEKWSDNEQWHLVSTSQSVETLAYVLDQDDFYDHVEFVLTVRRKTTHYLVQIIIPSALIAVAELATFSLPIGEFLKLHVSFTCLVAYTFFQVMIVDELPRSSDHVPILSIYVDLQMFYIALTMVGEGVVFILLSKAEPSYNGHEAVVPQRIFKIICVIGRMFFAGPPPGEEGPAAWMKKNNFTGTTTKHRASLKQPHGPKTDEEIRVYVTAFDSLTNSTPIVICSRIKNFVPEFDGTMGGSAPNRETEKRALVKRLLQHFDSEDQSLSGLHHDFGTLPGLNFASKSGSASNNSHKKMERLGMRQKRWLHIAMVVEQINLFFYLAAIVFTPVILFGVYPPTQPTATHLEALEI